MQTKSYHQQQVESFMLRAQQEVPVSPIPRITEAVRLLRAQLILEEALETVEALGVDVTAVGEDGRVLLTERSLQFGLWNNKKFDFYQTIDGCCDLKVVTTGTLSAIGVPDLHVQAEVDNNNLLKFGPGCEIRSDGKLIKPPGHQPPDLQRALASAVGPDQCIPVP